MDGCREAGGQEQREADVPGLGTVQLGNVPHPVVTQLAGGSGSSLWWSVCMAHSPCVWTSLVPLKLSLIVACGPCSGDPPGPTEHVSCECGSGVKPPSSSTCCGSCQKRVAAGTGERLCCLSCVTRTRGLSLGPHFPHLRNGAVEVSSGGWIIRTNKVTCINPSVRYLARVNASGRHLFITFDQYF